MEEKKSGFFKSVLARNRAEKDVDAKKKENEEMLQEEQNKDEKSVIEENEPISIEEANRMDILYRLYSRWCQYEGATPMDVLFEQWTKEPALKQIEEKGMDNAVSKVEIFRKQMFLAADKVIRGVEVVENAAKKDTEGVIKLPPDIDVEYHVQIPAGGMEAFVMVFPPFGDGKPMDEQSLYMAIGEAGVVSGIQRKLVKKIAEEQLYFQIFMIAVGHPAIPGIDGSIVEHIPREELLSYTEDESGNIDLKEMNLFRSINKGDVICDIIPPKDGTDGQDVKGTVVKAAQGKKPAVPAGKNTEYTEDGLKLVASIDGHISFEKGKFRVENQLIIKGNIDNAVGNQDFLGDIIVQGDVLSGFKLKATGNITVKGVVEGAVLIADGDIQIGDGANGNNCGEIRAGGNVKSTFLENIKVFAGGNIDAESMISCEAHCNGSVNVCGGIGVIIGGEITAGKSVTSNIIGSKAHRKTEIVLGMLPESRKKLQEKNQELSTAENTRELLSKNINFLESAQSLSEEKANLLQQLKAQETLYENMESELKKEISEIEETVTTFVECFVQARIVFPPTRITIGGSSNFVETETHKCRFYYTKEGEVVLGTD